MSKLIAKYMPMIVVSNSKQEKRTIELEPCESYDEALEMLNDEMGDLNYNHNHRSYDEKPEYGYLQPIFVID